MTRPIIALVFLPVAVAAAPVRLEPEGQRIRRLYGEPADPSGQGTFAIVGNRLTIRSATPVSDMASPALTATLSNPRTTRTLTGDFDLVVKMTGPTAPDRGAGYLGTEPFTQSAVYATGDGVAVSIGRLIGRRVGQNRVVSEYLDPSIWLDEYRDDGGSNGSRLAETDLGRPVYLRMTRTQGALTVWCSDDGRAWLGPWEPDRVALPDVVTVGVFLSQTVDQKCEATFEPFVLTQPGK